MKDISYAPPYLATSKNVGISLDDIEQDSVHF
jgi:hypothetical protein